MIKVLVMDVNDFLERFSELFDETPRSEITEDIDFKNMDEWSSLIGLSVIAMVDEYYSVRITGEDIRNSKTILELYTVVSEKANG